MGNRIFVSLTLFCGRRLRVKISKFFTDLHRIKNEPKIYGR